MIPPLHTHLPPRRALGGPDMPPDPGQDFGSILAELQMKQDADMTPAIPFPGLPADHGGSPDKVDSSLHPASGQASPDSAAQPALQVLPLPQIGTVHPADVPPSAALAPPFSSLPDAPAMPRALSGSPPVASATPAPLPGDDLPETGSISPEISPAPSNAPGKTLAADLPQVDPGRADPRQRAAVMAMAAPDVAGSATPSIQPSPMPLPRQNPPLPPDSMAQSPAVLPQQADPAAPADRPADRIAEARLPLPIPTQQVSRPGSGGALPDAAPAAPASTPPRQGAGPAIQNDIPLPRLAFVDPDAADPKGPAGSGAQEGPVTPDATVLRMTENSLEHGKKGPLWGSVPGLPPSLDRQITTPAVVAASLAGSLPDAPPVAATPASVLRDAAPSIPPAAPAMFHAFENGSDMPGSSAQASQAAPSVTTAAAHVPAVVTGSAAAPPIPDDLAAASPGPDDPAADSRPLRMAAPAPATPPGGASGPALLALPDGPPDQPAMP